MCKESYVTHTWLGFWGAAFFPRSSIGLAKKFVWVFWKLLKNNKKPKWHFWPARYMWDPLDTLGYTSQSVPYPFPICLNIYSNSESIPKKHLQILPLDLFSLFMASDVSLFPLHHLKNPLCFPQQFNSSSPSFRIQGGIIIIAVSHREVMYIETLIFWSNYWLKKVHVAHPLIE